jgi:hypothetical protein
LNNKPNFPLAPGYESVSAGGYKEYFNGDGKVSISDVIALLLMARENPGDVQVDYKGAGFRNRVPRVRVRLGAPDITPHFFLISGDTALLF